VALSSGSAFRSRLHSAPGRRGGAPQGGTEQQRRVANEEESLAYARKQRPEQERARKAQTDAAEADRQSRQGHCRSRSQGCCRQGAHRRPRRASSTISRRAPTSAPQSRATTAAAARIASTRRGVQHDLATKRIVIDDPVEGKIDTTTDILRAGIDSDMERGTAAS
jgi:hypothetical protein